MHSEIVKRPVRQTSRPASHINSPYVARASFFKGTDGPLAGFSQSTMADKVALSVQASQDQRRITALNIQKLR